MVAFDIRRCPLSIIAVAVITILCDLKFSSCNWIRLCLLNWIRKVTNKKSMEWCLTMILHLEKYNMFFLLIFTDYSCSTYLINISNFFRGNNGVSMIVGWLTKSIHTRCLSGLVFFFWSAGQVIHQRDCKTPL